MADLADLIIDHGPYDAGHLVLASFASGLLNPDKLNTLREELIEGRRLRAAAETLATFEIDAVYSPRDLYVTLEHDHCPEVVAELEAPVRVADLVRRADEHAEGCR